MTAPRGRRRGRAPAQPRLLDMPVRRLPTALVRGMSEHEFQENVVHLARRHGWKVNHVYATRLPDGTWVTPTTYKGFPDLTMVKRGQFLHLEVKAVDGVATLQQRQWIALAQTVPGVRAYIVDPTDWPEVHALLTIPWTSPGEALDT